MGEAVSVGVVVSDDQRLTYRADAVMPPEAARDLVRLVETIVIAERAA